MYLYRAIVWARLCHGPVIADGVSAQLAGPRGNSAQSSADHAQLGLDSRTLWHLRVGTKKACYQPDIGAILTPAGLPTRKPH